MGFFSGIVGVLSKVVSVPLEAAKKVVGKILPGGISKLLPYYLAYQTYRSLQKGKSEQVADAARFSIIPPTTSQVGPTVSPVYPSTTGVTTAGFPMFALVAVGAIVLLLALKKR